MKNIQFTDNEVRFLKSLLKDNRGALRRQATQLRDQLHSTDNTHLMLGMLEVIQSKLNHD